MSKYECEKGESLHVCSYDSGERLLASKESVLFEKSNHKGEKVERKGQVDFLCCFSYEHFEDLCNTFVCLLLLHRQVRQC